MKARLSGLINGRSAVIGIPYVWLLVFFLFPLPLFILAGVGVADNVKPLWRSLPKPSSTNP